MTTMRVLAFLGVLGLAPAVSALTLGEGDVVRITVYDHPDLTTVSRVSSGGKLNLPLVGDIEVEGLDERGVEARIEAALAAGKFVQNPQVTVMLEEFRSAEISVLGAVNRPGRYPLEARATLVDAIALAGGVNAAGGDEAVLLRRSGTEEEARSRVDLRGMLTQGDIRLDPELRGGDIVYVPPFNVFYVYGEVQRPGSFRLEPEMTVIQALSVAGSLSERGTQRGLQIRRRGQGGAEEVAVELDDPVRPNDVIYVREALF